MKIIYLSSAYLAPVEYYAKLVAYDKIFIEQHDHYVKQTYRNRCTIAAPDGELALSIPTVKRLLATTGFSPQQICDQIGLENVSYFYRQFKKSSGVTPQQYRERHFHGESRALERA